MIVLFTDYGVGGPYTGQVKAVLAREAPGVPVVDLFADAPRCNPKAAAYLLAAYVDEFPPETVFLGVVDPGVGTAREAVVVRADGRWYVGPDNGLFEMVVRRAAAPAAWWMIRWRPASLSSTFHGRDLFAPVAARLARGERPAEAAAAGVAWAVPCPEGGQRFPEWPKDWADVIYIDPFGNAMTGVTVRNLPAHAIVMLPDGREIPRARTFSDVSLGEPFWYENANGLLEIAVNQGRADACLGLRLGTSISIRDTSSDRRNKS